MAPSAETNIAEFIDAYDWRCGTDCRLFPYIGSYFDCDATLGSLKELTIIHNNESAMAIEEIWPSVETNTIDACGWRGSTDCSVFPYIGSYYDYDATRGSLEGITTNLNNEPAVAIGVNLGVHQEWTGCVNYVAMNPLESIPRSYKGAPRNDEMKSVLIQKDEYKRARMKEIKGRKNLADQLKLLTSEQERYKREREAIRQQLRKRQEDKDRCYHEEQRLLQQELAKLKLELQQKDRELQTHLEQKCKEYGGSFPAPTL